MARESWDDYFLGLAARAATRSTCVRRQVGAVIAQSNRVRSTGYNGSPSGYGHCSDGACPAGLSQDPTGENSRSEECIAIHAEANALLHCETLHREGATIYCTDFPCLSCAKLISNSGVMRVVYAGGLYAGWEQVRDFMKSCRVLVIGRTHD